MCVTGTFSNAANAADFSGGVLPGGTLIFAAGETSKTLTVEAAADKAAKAEGRSGFHPLHRDPRRTACW